MVQGESTIDYKHYWDKAVTYRDYRMLIDRLLAGGKSTGPRQTENLRHYSELNVQRMSRLDRTTELSKALLEAIDGVSVKPLLLTITEGWCGDAAQIVPVLEKVAREAGLPSRYILRDEHSQLMEQHLTQGTRSIPVVLFLHPETFQLLAGWGPRPAPLQQMMMDWKAAPQPKVDKGELKKNMQLWYARDRQATMQEEWTALFQSL